MTLTVAVASSAGNTLVVKIPAASPLFPADPNGCVGYYIGISGAKVASYNVGPPATAGTAIITTAGGESVPAGIKVGDLVSISKEAPPSSKPDPTLKRPLKFLEPPSYAALEGDNFTMLCFEKDPRLEAGCAANWQYISRCTFFWNCPNDNGYLRESQGNRYCSDGVKWSLAAQQGPDNINELFKQAGNGATPESKYMCIKTGTRMLAHSQQNQWQTTANWANAMRGFKKELSPYYLDKNPGPTGIALWVAGSQKGGRRHRGSRRGGRKGRRSHRRRH
jgi:hypothetical protein